MSDIGTDLLVGYAWVALGYFVLILVAYSAITLMSLVYARRQLRRTVHARLQRSVRSSLTPPISVLVPCFNEEDVIVDSVRSLRALRYPQHEVVVTNDGSTDASLERLVEAFGMRRVDQPVPGRLAYAHVRGVYRSRSQPSLVVIDKENGGRSDALNAAIDHARSPLVCCVDAVPSWSPTGCSSSSARSSSARTARSRRAGSSASRTGRASSAGTSCRPRCPGA